MDADEDVWLTRDWRTSIGVSAESAVSGISRTAQADLRTFRSDRTEFLGIGAVVELISLLFAQNGFDVAAAAQHSQHKHTVAVESIRDDVLADWERANARTEIVITLSIITVGLLAFRWIVNRMPVLKEHPDYPAETSTEGK